MKKVSGTIIAAFVWAFRGIVRAGRQMFREHDDEVLPRELIVLALALSMAATVLGLNSEEHSNLMIWRIAADGFVLNTLSNLALVGPSLVIANVVVARWRRRRQIKAVLPALDRIYGLVDLALYWSDNVWVVLHDIDPSVAPDPISYQAPADDGKRTVSAKSLEDQIELIIARSRALRGRADLFDISGQQQPQVQPGALPDFMYGFGASLMREGMLKIDAALSKSTNLGELVDRVAAYQRLRRRGAGFADLADSAGLVLESLMWILLGLKDSVPSHLRYLMEVDFDQVHANRSKRLQAEFERTHPEWAAQLTRGRD